MAEVDDFLAHYGVRGMKWGKRKQARVTRREIRGQAQIKKAGSTKRAAVRIIGQEAAQQIIAVSSQRIVSGLIKEPSLALGINAIIGLGSFGVTVSNINRGVDLHAAKNKDK